MHYWETVLVDCIPGEQFNKSTEDIICQLDLLTLLRTCWLHEQEVDGLKPTGNFTGNLSLTDCIPEEQINK